MTTGLRNHIAVVVVSKYDDSKTWPALETLHPEQTPLKKLYQPFDPAVELNPTSDDAFGAIRSTLASAEPGSMVVIHWVGHGETDGNEFFLICKNSPQPNLLNARCSIPAVDLGREMARCRARCITLVVDTCYSGAAVSDLAADLLRRMRISTPLVNDGKTVRIIGASNPLSHTVAGEMSRAIIAACAQLDTSNSHVDISEIRAIAARDLNLDTSQWRTAETGWERRTFPNPNFRQRDGATDIESRRRLEAVQPDQHFNLAARGVEVGGSGYFFSGRHETLRRLSDWLKCPAPGMLIVTGSPGTGKSALIGRIILSSLPEQLDAMIKAGAFMPGEPTPPLGAIRCAIHAKGKSIFDVATVIGATVGLSEPVRDQAGINNAVETYARKSGGTLVIDALDEAAEGQASRIVGEIIRPLQNSGSTKFLLGTRYSLDGRPLPEGEARHRRLAAEFPGAIIIDVDDEPDTEADISVFARARLTANAQCATDSWIRGSADAVVKVVGKDFLAARLLVRSLEDRPNSKFDDLPSAARAAFLWDVRHRFPDDVPRVVDMMRALSFGCGRGLSRQVWPQVANALGAANRQDIDVDFMLSRVGSYIIETSVQTAGVFQSAFRLIHQSIADFFLEHSEKGHGHIAAALMTGQKGHNWFSVDAYLRRHLAEHARRGGVVDELFAHPGYLAVAEEDDVLLAIPAAREWIAIEIGRIYRFVADESRELPPPDRWRRLQAAASFQGILTFTERFLPPLFPRIVWARTTPRAMHQTLRGHDGWISSVALGDVDGRPTIVSGSDDKTIRLWDARTGKSIGDPIIAHGKSVSSVAIGDVGGRPLIISGSHDETVRLWDARSGAPLGKPLRGHHKPVLCVAIGDVDGRAMIVSGSEDRTLRRWDASTGEEIGEPLHGHQSAVVSVTMGKLDGRPIIVSGSYDKTIQLWDARSGITIREPLLGHEAPILSVGMGRVDDQVLIVSGSDDGNILLWNVGSDAPVGEASPGHEEAIFSVGIGDVDGRPTIVSGSDDQTLCLWSARSGSQIGNRLRGHENSILSIAIGKVDGHTKIVSSSKDCTLRIWEPRIDTSIKERKDPVISIAIGKLNERSVIIARSLSKIDGLLDARTGEMIGDPFPDNIKCYSTESIAMCAIDDRLMFVTCHYNSLVLWDARTGASIRELLYGHRGLCSITIGEINGRKVIVSGDYDGTIRLMDIRTGEQIGRPLRNHDKDDSSRYEGSVTSVALGKIDRRSAIVSGHWNGTVYLWDALTGEQIGNPLEDHSKYSSVTSVTLCDLGNRQIIVSAYKNNRPCIWDARTGELIRRMHPTEDYWINMVAKRQVVKKQEDQSVFCFALGDVNGRQVLVHNGTENTLYCEDPLSGTLLKEIAVPYQITSLAIDTDETIFVGCERGVFALELSNISPNGGE